MYIQFNILQYIQPPFILILCGFLDVKIFICNNEHWAENFKFGLVSVGLV